MKRLTLLLGLIAVLASCASVSYKTSKVLPYYTEPAKIVKLQNGMTLTQINSVLGIEPYDVYHMQDDGSTVLVYKYRLKERKIEVTTSDDLTNQASQTSGTVYFTEEYKVYILLQDGKLQSLITDAGRKDSKYILITNNTIQLVSKKTLIEKKDSEDLREGQWKETTK
ncbi:hypothetical protein SAMN05216474_2862 [Lishizhenia tianjinensis]|uniref:Lipoprotein n=1 Tax=Lishizhenia tianjinensis TaxID=477690 RepID=A0A1I7BL60_9FLAO|nr:hypothetical protein [Lishizhenia tianjinensis]SFT87896.1 hypothetical protein SAMN05216474_2862 [Lishizhenia tianjinensis]